MFVFGHRTRTESFSGAREKVMRCDSCADMRLHHEQRTVHAATAFFVPVANVRSHHVWVCVGCGVVSAVADRDATWAGDQTGTLTGQVVDAVGTASEAATPLVTAAAHQAGVAAGQATEAVRSADLPARGRRAWTAMQRMWEPTDSSPEVADEVADAEELEPRS